jgi:hypothetical protein
MPTRVSWLLLFTVSLAATAGAKDKSKAALPEIVLRAETAFVVIDPDAGEPLDHPTANATARDNVEKALMQWGRLRLVMDGQEADLVISVRSGSRGAPTVKGGPIDQRQQGHPPNSDPTTPGPQDNGPRIGKESGSPDDAFEVHLRSVESSAIWRYVAKDCLRAPEVTAVEQFRKAIAESEKQQQKKP